MYVRLYLIFWNYWKIFKNLNFFLSAVVILCFLCTITTNFEYELKCSKVGYDFVNGQRCIFTSATDDALCNVEVFDPVCNTTRFDESTGKPCGANQTKVSGLCQEVRDVISTSSTRIIDFSLLLFSHQKNRFIRTVPDNQTLAGLRAIRIFSITHQLFSVPYCRLYCWAFWMVSLFGQCENRIRWDTQWLIPDRWVFNFSFE